LFADWLANQAVERKKSFLWVADNLDWVQACCLIGYADGACKTLSGIGASGYALIAVHPGSRRAGLVAAGARYWSECTAIQAELAAAAFLCRTLAHLLANGRVGALFSTSIVRLKWADGLAQLQDTLSNQIKVAGKFVCENV